MKSTFSWAQLRLAALVLILITLLAACSGTPAPAPSEPPPPPEAPSIDITGPSDGAVVSQDDVLVTGVLNDAVTEMNYVVNGGQVWPVEFAENTYAFPLEDLTLGENVVQVTVINADGEETVVRIILNYDPASAGEVAETFYVSNNGPANAGQVNTFSGAYSPESTFLAGNNTGIALDRFGDLYQAGNTAGGPSVRAISEIFTRPNGDFDPQRDREILGSATRLVEPKGMDIAEAGGYLFVADNGAFINTDNVVVFNTLNDGNVAPVATTKLAVKPWDLVYDEGDDRLFVSLTDGTVAVFDRYVGGGFGRTGPDTILVPADRLGEQISTNLRGIDYNANLDALVITDVGTRTTPEQEGFAEDGAIYVIHDASAEDGTVIPGRILEGPATLLGNPLDVVLNGTEARVAEKAGDKLLVFNDIFFARSGDVAPDVAVTNTKPESVVLSPDEFDPRPDTPEPPGGPGQGGNSARQAVSYLSPEANDNVEPDSSCLTPDRFDTQAVVSFDDGSTNVLVLGCLLAVSGNNGSRVDGTASFETTGVGGVYSCPDPDGSGPKTSTATDTDGDGLNNLCTVSGFEPNSTEYGVRLLSEIAGAQVILFCPDANANGCADERVRSRIEINWTSQ